MPDVVNPMLYERAASQLHYGSYSPATTNEMQRRGGKLSGRWGNNPVSHMLNDFEFVLSTLFADEAKRDREYSKASGISIPTSEPRDCNLDVLKRIWAVVFPHRQLLVGEDKIAARAAALRNTPEK